MSETQSNVWEIRSSEIDRFMRCRRSWYLSYRRQLEPNWGLRLQPKGFDVGNAVHAGLGAFYPDHDLAAGHAAIDEHKAEMYSELNPEADMKEWESAYKKAHAMLEHYPAWLDSEGLDIGEETVDIERRLSAPLGEFYGWDVVLTGQPDHVKVTREGHLILEDWKTGSIDRPTLMESDWQLLNYAWLIHEMHGRYPLEVRHRRLKPSMHTARAKSPQYAEHAVSFTPSRVETHLKHLSRVVSQMAVARILLDGGENPVFSCTPTRLSTSCNWDCSFVEVCSQMCDGADWEHTLEINYRTREAQ